MNEQELIKALRERTYSGRGGISFAKSALASVEGCFVGGICPDKIFGLASPDEWTAALKESENALVYDNPSMRAKSYTEDVPAGYCLVFDAVLTTVSKDHDGDILESSGAEVDPRMPLLWQHIPLHPIGKHFKVTRQTSKRVEFRAGIADIDLGRDAATLVKLDALRISHGFKPIDFEPITEKGSDGKDYITGFRVKKFKVLEASLVSVPSNGDAVITAYSQQKLHNPLVKQWARTQFDSRRRVVRSGYQKSLTEPITLPIRIKLEGMDMAVRQVEELSRNGCSCHAGKDSPPGKSNGTVTWRVAPEEYAKGVAMTDADMAKPYPNHHACRLREPSDFEDGSFRTTSRESGGKKYNVIMGRLKGEDSLTEQAYRYPKDTWTESSARTHCKNHDGAKFEAAEDETANEEAGAAVAGKSLNTTKGLHGPIPLMMPPVQGSWEFLSCELEAAAHEWLSESADVKEYDDVLLLATFPDRGIVAVCGWSPVPKACYEGAWEIQEGKPAWLGEPRPVEITTNISAAAAGSLVRKALRGDLPRSAKSAGAGGAGSSAYAHPLLVKYAKIRKKDRDRITDANDLVKQVTSDTNTSKGSKVLLEKASSLLNEVLVETEAAPDVPSGESASDAGGDTGGTEPKGGVDALKRRILAEAACGRASADDLRRARDEIDLMVAAASGQKFTGEWDTLLNDLVAAAP